MWKQSEVKFSVNSIFFAFFYYVFWLVGTLYNSRKLIIFGKRSCIWWLPWGGSEVKNPPANAGDMGSISGSARSPGEGNGNPLQHSCLGNPVVRAAGGPQSTGLQRVRHNSVTKQEFLIQGWSRNLFFFFLMNAYPVFQHLSNNAIFFPPLTRHILVSCEAFRYFWS